MKLLLVEDSQVSQAAFSAALEEFYHSQYPTVEIAGTLADAHAMVHAADVLVLDLTLPDADADEMMAFARKWIHLKPVIIISGTEEDRYIIEAGAIGAGFLRKTCVSCQQAEMLRIELLRAQGALQAKREKRELVHDFIRVLGSHT
jgi:DNA-binding response OmpR family regulator